MDDVDENKEGLLSDEETPLTVIEEEIIPCTIPKIRIWTTSLLSEVKILINFSLINLILDRFVVKVIYNFYVYLLNLVDKINCVVQMQLKKLIDLMSIPVFHHYIMLLGINN
jgi:hypothetical protein